MVEFRWSLRRAREDTRPGIFELMSPIGVAVEETVRAGLMDQPFYFWVAFVAGLAGAVVLYAVRFVGNLWMAPALVIKDDYDTLAAAYEKLSALRDERIATLLSDAGAKPKDLTVSHKLAEYGERYSEWMLRISPLPNDSREWDQVITGVDELYDEVVQYIESEPSLGKTWLYKFKSTFNAPKTLKHRTPRDWSKEKVRVFIQVMANAERLTRIVNELSTEPTP